ncbi:MAG TPA: tRNA uracil 4-sulfurtransferase ThiI [Oscillospiraceae bacterium]|nr:tRNA uracil 4-sulfurtransferase ThiI [Oscillospiraceae bacterium]HPF56135.1 tRNA uracil 4-sulfurtransferase ThiI [Clostridiales bacterium]HPK35407.1 tRNA uracil 4-sulfurtransferase ThiI [Oscillospiraceae bacterium]HPR75300.1 tRNA uracil 4-sulfurtransferase ThiI [Oscillospiraceae bacterium]
MQEVILLKLGETVLKGLNRNVFEDMLLRNLRRRLKRVGSYRVSFAQSTIYIVALENKEGELSDIDKAQEVADRLFGAVTVARAAAVEKDYDKIAETAVEYCADELSRAKTFKVAAKRADKHFPMNSPQICAELGGYLLDHFPNLSVDIHNPEVTVTVEIRDWAAYVHCGSHKGAGGLPTGTSGKGMVLISGGLDSPVAAWMMGRRGQILEAIHFESPPYTGPQAVQKVIDLLRKVSQYAGRINLYIVGFTEIQEAIANNCPEPFFTIIMRRFMMRIAQRQALATGCECLITGESLGQVASQTIGALACTDAVCEMPVLRPLIGTDKEEIIQISRRLDTYDISILPYEDCCTVFTPKHPKTKPHLDEIIEAEAALDIDGLIENAMATLKKININP